VTVNEVNQLVERFFEARKMMQQVAGRFGFPGAALSRRSRKGGRKAKKGKGRGPTPPRTRSALPSGLPGSLPDNMPEFPDLANLSGFDQLPPGFDPSKLKFRKK
jgi:signal recognition particle subunit SRP54